MLLQRGTALHCGRAVRIVTFNIQHARTPAGSVDTDALAAYCAGLEADVLGLQEVDVGLRRSGRVDQATAVARATGMSAVFGAARRVGLWGRYGNVLLVRGHMREPETLALPRTGRHEQRAAVLATVEIGGRRLSVAAAHLSVDRSEAATQLEAVVSALRARPAPRVLLGDLNLRPERAVPALERSGLVVAMTAAATYPAHAPFLRIDHVAVDGLAMGRVAALDAGPVSDHRALLVEVD